jgi:ATP citrate (pro-S)-lyase
MSMSQIIHEDMGVGGTLGLLWFRRRLPDYFLRFIEMVLIVTADHGPAVSGAHNTIVTARAGKVRSGASAAAAVGRR